MSAPRPAAALRGRSTRLPLAPESLGYEARAGAEDHQSLRLWLRLLACTNQLETELRRRLQQRFGISLARFDFLAQLHRHPEGVSMGALSNHLMVTGGSVTGLTSELVKEGLVSRAVDKADRRSYLLKLTAAGRKAFEGMAAEHEAWVVAMFSGFAGADRDKLAQLLGQLRLHVAQGAGVPAEPGR